MKNTLFTLVFAFFCLIINGQNCIKGKIEELSQLKEKPLAVVLYEENKDLVKKLGKKIAKNNKKSEEYKKELKEYRDFISYFNTTIKEVVPDYWTLNDTKNIKYITEGELTKDKLKNYAILNLTSDVIITDLEFLTSQKNYVITYGASEKNRNKAVFQNYLTNVNYNIPGYADKELKKSIEKLKQERQNGPKYLSKENLIVSLALAQKYIEKAIELNNKISFEDFAGEEMKNNCSQLEGKTILFQEAIVHGKIKNELQNLLPTAKIELVSTDRIAQAVDNNEDILIGFPVTKKFVKQKGLGVMSVIPVTHKMIMNAKTKKIVAFVPHSGITSYSYFKKKDFKKLSEPCK
ncbi:hypothetical protein P8625_12175 [Tenacibaculum tangerinum]|uniref:Uncharacterized protein n=1 Tax=Tenacibaculum tangerinum TaxID=3038772 RepID=A0ABY8L0F8_9FLAO|nr:hypothetical protein [Tenacibaculum tangerinum]WGH74830.1 hypothetical protein P8625_12175 [Tenacibaculum tangerinum]